MQSMLKDAQEKKFSAIFIYKLDRFSRSLKDLILTIDYLKEIGVDFVSLQDKIETASASGKLMFHIISAFAEFERNIIGDRTKFGMERKAKEGGFITKAPKGYIIVNKQLIPSENSNEIREIFQEFLDTEISLTKLAKKFQMTTSGMKKLLQNKTYIGIVKFASQETDGQHKPLLSKQLFTQVQEKLKSKGWIN
jgi:site-specific DNA recombinase